MITDPLVAGGGAALILKGLNILDQIIQKKRNGANGRASSNGFTISDHDKLHDIASGIDRLHEDLTGMRQDLRDCLRDKNRD